MTPLVKSRLVMSSRVLSSQVESCPVESSLVMSRPVKSSHFYQFKTTLTMENYHPFQHIEPGNFDFLKEGDFISSQQLEELFGCSVAETKYHRKLNQLRQQMDDYFKREQVQLIVVQKDNGLYIPKQSEAYKYLDRRQESFVNNIFKKQDDKMSRVDVSQLNDIDRRKHANNIVKGAILTSEILRAKRVFHDERMRQEYLPPNQA